MPVQRIVKYETSDGEEFTDKTEANAHEVVIETEEALRKILITGLSTGRLDAVTSVMVLNAPLVRDELNRFLRRQPTAKKKST